MGIVIRNRGFALNENQVNKAFDHLVSWGYTFTSEHKYQCGFYIQHSRRVTWHGEGVEFTDIDDVLDKLKLAEVTISNFLELMRSGKYKEQPFNKFRVELNRSDYYGTGNISVRECPWETGEKTSGSMITLSSCNVGIDFIGDDEDDLNMLENILIGLREAIEKGTEFNNKLKESKI